MLSREIVSNIADQEMVEGFEHLRDELIDEAVEAVDEARARSWIRQGLYEAGADSHAAKKFEEQAYGRD